MPERYLKIPYHILNIERLGLSEKVLLAHIYSFGQKGCWQSNTTLAKIFFIQGRTISRWVRTLKKAGLILWVHPKGRYRTLWVKSHPEVQTAQYLYYMGEKISKEAVVKGHAAKILQGHNCQGGIDKTGVPTATKSVFQVRQNCPHINNTTKKDTNGETTAPPSPLPAGGQASAVLEERKNGSIASIEQLENTFGSGALKQKSKLTNGGFEESRQRNQKQVDSMLALEADEKSKKSQEISVFCT